MSNKVTGVKVSPVSADTLIIKDSENGNQLTEILYSNVKGDKGDQGDTGVTGTPGSVGVYGITIGTDLSSATPVIIPLDTDTLTHTDYTHSTTVSNSQIVVGATAVYKVEVFMPAGLTTASDRFTFDVGLRTNGTTSLTTVESGYIRGSTGIDSAICLLTQVISLTAADYVEVMSNKSNANTNSTLATLAGGQVIITRLS